MPVMNHLNVGGVTYDTVGEASVTQVQTSGTKIATVSIDGTNTDIYAPEGGSSVDPATASPSMDGTAAVGTSVKYAREDHVHPSDTSKQATLVSGTNIKTVNSTSLLGSGDVAVQPTLVSGTNIKTVNSTSLLGSGDVAVQPTLVSGTNIKTVNSTSLLGSGDVAVQPTLVSGTNIKTVNNESLLGSGNIAIQSGGTALTTAEIEEAVEDAFPVVAYTITDISGGATHSITTDGTYGSGAGYVTEAEEGDTVTIGLPSMWTPIVTEASSGTSVPHEYIGYTGIEHGWSFTMPAANVNINAYFDD